MTRSRSALAVAIALVVVEVVLVALAVAHGPMPLPVVAHLGGAAVRISTLQVGVAVLVPPLLVAVVAGLRAAGLLERTAVVWAVGAAAPIVLVLVARLNGLAETVAIVLVYASSAGGVLLRSLHRRGGDPVPLRGAAVLGIVPWGVVAFTQIGGGLTGTPPSAAIRVLTLVVLAASVLEYVVAYVRRDRPPLAAGLLLAALPGVLLALLVLTAVR